MAVLEFIVGLGLVAGGIIGIIYAGKKIWNGLVTIIEFIF